MSSLIGEKQNNKESEKDKEEINTEILKILYNGKYCNFYPLKSVIYGDELDHTLYSGLPDKVYGKILGGVCGYEPWWVYKHVNRKDIKLFVVDFL